MKNLSGVATADLCTLIKTLYPDNENIKSLSEQQINALTNDMNIKVVHYCHHCSNTFPEDPDQFRCTNEGCIGLRYKGGLRRQTRNSRQPRKSFVIGDIESQLSKILQRNGIWSFIQE